MRLWQTLRKIPKAVWYVLGFLAMIGGAYSLVRMLPLVKVGKYITNLLQQFTPLWLFLVSWLVIICLLLWLTKRPRTQKDTRPSLYKDISGIDWETSYSGFGLTHRLKSLCPQCADELEIQHPESRVIHVRCNHCGFDKCLSSSEREFYQGTWREIRRRKRTGKYKT